jgi:hypothetical protein
MLNVFIHADKKQECNTPTQWYQLCNSTGLIFAFRAKSTLWASPCLSVCLSVCCVLLVGGRQHS